MTHENAHQTNDRKDDSRTEVAITQERCKIERDNRGFTMVELLVVVAIIGILAVMAMSGFARVKQMAQISRCESDIRTLERSIIAYQTDKGFFPTTPASGSLSDTGVNQGGLRDPWGNFYRYKKIDNDPAITGLKGADNTQYNKDFDLYSMGPDGDSATTYDPDAPSVSDDDIVRGGDGGFVGRRY